MPGKDEERQIRKFVGLLDDSIISSREINTNNILQKRKINMNKNKLFLDNLNYRNNNLPPVRIFLDINGNI